MATLTTPLMSLPYPDGTERVMDGDNAIGALAQAIDAPLGRQHQPPGVVVTGPARTMLASSETIPLNAVLSGIPGWFNDAADAIVLPTGFDAIYFLWASGLATLPTGGGFLRIALRQGGTVLAGQSVATFTGTTSYWTVGIPWFLAASSQINLIADCASGNLATITPQKFGVIRMGVGYSASLLREGPESKPAK